MVAETIDPVGDWRNHYFGEGGDTYSGEGNTVKAAVPEGPEVDIPETYGTIVCGSGGGSVCEVNDDADDKGDQKIGGLGFVLEYFK